MDVGDLRQFARNFGKWLYGVNPDLDAEKLKAMIQRFTSSAPIDIGENSALNVEEFYREAARGYASGGEASETGTEEKEGRKNQSRQ